MTQYMLLLHQAPNYNTDLPREKMLEMTKRYMAWADALRQKGRMVGGEKLAVGGVRHIKVKDGKPVASDGPYAEAKDVIGGYFVIEAKDLAEAEAIARDCPHLVLSSTNWVEIRPIDDMPARPARPRAEMSVHRLVDSLARNSTSRLVAALARRLGAGRIAVAEDAVQHALMQALSFWPFKGVPDKPEAWLAIVARNRALDLLRHEARNVALADEVFTVEPQLPASDGHFDRELNDDELALLFAVCHPALSPEMRVTFALKTVCGLTVPQIASGLLSEPTTIAQRLVRARKQLEAAGVAIEAPPPEALPERAESVRTALYLMFNEGYSASSGEALVQPEFCVEAVRLSRALAQHPVTAGPASDALAALLALTAARLPTRVGPDGVAQLLEDQPRSQWDRGLIALGFAHLERSAAGGELTVWHLRAEIASLHAVAPSTEATDWRRIVESTTSCTRSIRRRSSSWRAPWRSGAPMVRWQAWRHYRSPMAIPTAMPRAECSWRSSAAQARPAGISKARSALRARHQSGG